MNITSDTQNEINALEAQRQSLSEKIGIGEFLLDNFMGSADAFKVFRSQHQATCRELANVNNQLWRLHRERAHEEREFERNRFERPSSGFFGLLSRPLGPLPERAVAITPTDEALASVPRYRGAAFLLIVVAISLIIGLSLLVPWLAISPISVIHALIESMFGKLVANIASPLILAVLLTLVSLNVPIKGRSGEVIADLAMFEEQWFRMGAEKWTTRQRVVSCGVFGAMHFANMFYPLASLIVLSLVGGVFMTVYLREYSRSGSVERATLASAKFHATYNRFAFLYHFTALGISFVVSVVL